MKYIHKEAYCLMWYRCDSCYHMERIWNSRDGVTPFGMGCPSCGSSGLRHYAFNLDECVPDYQPYPGQKYWRDMTMAEATDIAKRRITMVVNSGYTNAPTVEVLATSIYGKGNEPMLAIHRYERSYSPL